MPVFFLNVSDLSNDVPYTNRKFKESFLSFVGYSILNEPYSSVVACLFNSGILTSIFFVSFLFTYTIPATNKSFSKQSPFAMSCAGSNRNINANTPNAPVAVNISLYLRSNSPGMIDAKAAMAIEIIILKILYWLFVGQRNCPYSFILFV